MKIFAPLCAIFLAPISAYPEPPEPPRPSPKWSVHAEVLMVAMPQEKLLPLLPDLRDPAKIDAAVARILAAVQRKEAILTGYPSVTTSEGRFGEAEATEDKRFYYTFEVLSAPDSKAVHEPLPPPEGESRRVGASFGMTPRVLDRGNLIELQFGAYRCEFLGMKSGSSLAEGGGKILKTLQPDFFRADVHAEMTIPQGQRALIGVHLIRKPENYMEIFVLQAWATPVN
jgi:hypothetical protein